MMHRRIAFWVGLTLALTAPAAQGAPDAAEPVRDEAAGGDVFVRALGSLRLAAGSAARSLTGTLAQSVTELKDSAARAARLEPTPYGGAGGQAPTVDQLAFRLTQTGQFDPLIAAESERWGLDPFLLKGLLLNESGLNPKSIGRKRYGWVRGRRRVISGGSVGIAQFSASGIRGVTGLRRQRAGFGDTVETFTYEKALEPEKAIPAAAEVLSYYISHYGRDGGVTAYNTGAVGGELVRKHGFWRARGMRKLNRAGHVHLQGARFLLNVLRRTNRLRTEAGLPPLPAPEPPRPPEKEKPRKHREPLATS
jgi:soluble lytic murein transglycosylase-like protein